MPLPFRRRVPFRPRVNTPLLALAALTAVLVDRAAAPAWATDTPAEVPAPVALPASAFLTGPDLEASAEIDGIELRVVESDGSYALHLTNLGPSASQVSLTLTAKRTSGSAISRMPPLPTEVSTDQVNTALAPRARLRVPLSTPPAAVPEDPALAELSFQTTEFFVTAQDQPQAAVLARLALE